MEGKEPFRVLLTEREAQILERLSAGLSDQQIADDLYLSLNTVKWYNRQIYSKLGVSSRTQAIASARDTGFAQIITPTMAAADRKHGVPAQTSPFIGRSRELAEVKLLLNNCRLLTLSGTGGIGKTRLALHAAEDVAETFVDGVYFVDLAPLADHALVVNAIAAALGVVENPDENLLKTLRRALSGRQMLIVIDNFEHVIQAAPMLSELLAASPHLKILVTSRESLRISSEQEYSVPPMTLPLTGRTSLEAVTASEAAALFIQRAKMVQPYFELTEDNAEAIARICTRLDGLPLAIELAAARSKLLAPSAILERLTDSGSGSPLQALVRGSRDAPARHQTLQDSINWSYNLLDAEEKLLFARLAVFRGGRSLEAIEVICRGDTTTDMLELLSSLVDKSLVQQKEVADGEPRFVLLEMIHEDAWQRLEASGEAEVMRRRHAEYYASLVERAEPELRLARYDYWCDWFELERDNLRAALYWALSGGDVVLGVRLAIALGLFWYGKGHHVEGIRWTQQLLERLDEVPVTYHAKFLISAGQLAWMHDLDEAQRLFKKALDVSRRLGDRLQTAWSLTFLGYAMQQEPDAAISIAEEALELFREANHLPGIAQALNIVGEIARLSGDDDHAKLAYEECLAVCQQTGETRRICYMCTNLAYVAQHEGDHERAIRLGREALRLALARSASSDIVAALVIAAGSFAATGRAEQAACLLGAIDAGLERMGAFHQPSDKPEIDRIIAKARAQLDEDTYHAAWVEGSMFTLDQAASRALTE